MKFLLFANISVAINVSALPLHLPARTKWNFGPPKVPSKREGESYPAKNSKSHWIFVYAYKHDTTTISIRISYIYFKCQRSRGKGRRPMSFLIFIQTLDCLEIKCNKVDCIDCLNQLCSCKLKHFWAPKQMQTSQMHSTTLI